MNNKNKPIPLTQKHIDEVLKYCNDIVQFVWKQDYARTQRMFPNFNWTEEFFDNYIDSLADQYAVKGYQPISADKWLKMSAAEKEEFQKNPPMTKNIKNPSQVAKKARQEKEQNSKTSQFIR